MVRSNINEEKGRADGVLNQPLLRSRAEEEETAAGLGRKVWTETKKLWHILGPAIFTRVATYTMSVAIQVFAGHLGEVELAAASIANTVILGFNFSLVLGMASALETLCGQAFGAKRYHMLGIYMQRSFIVLLLCCFLLLPSYMFAAPLLRLLGQPEDSQLKTIIMAWVSLVALVVNLATSWLFVYVFDFGVIGLSVSLDLAWWVMVFGLYVYVSCGACPLTWTGWSVEAFSGLWEFIKLSAASGVMLW
ncbi:hypothetical protein CRG98_033911 [Punica granatum]|uniref:Protein DETOXIFICATION 27-like n=1 Tax=Punica granatum TaxID=22663 RepID=A0A2I0INL7_PUNGR|nr:hypothetical protein CRG98_033911 [Punica granatum]